MTSSGIFVCSTHFMDRLWVSHAKDPSNVYNGIKNERTHLFTFTGVFVCWTHFLDRLCVYNACATVHALIDTGAHHNRFSFNPCA